jgi:hypothetical protein
MKFERLRKKRHNKWILLVVMGLLLMWGALWRAGREPTTMRMNAVQEVRDLQNAPRQWKRTLQAFPTPRAAEPQPVESRSEERGRPYQERVVSPSAIVRYYPVVEEPANPTPVITEVAVPVQKSVVGEKEKVWLGPVAPTGRILQVELVNTIDSSLSNNPIVGLITHDFYWDGHLLIPAGTEVHGVATVETSRENLLTGKHWKLVFMGKHGTLPNGWVLPIQAVALERQDTTGEGRTFGWSDMRMGLPGIRMRAEDELDLKLFLSGFLSAAVSSMQTRQVNQFTGTSMVEETAENAALSGVVRVLQQYGERILQEIERVGFYLRVRAGTQFYLLLEEPLDLNRGTQGGYGERSADFHLVADKQKVNPPVWNLKSLQQMESQIGEQWDALWNQYMQTMGK